ncbi:ROK family protein [Flavobacteriaceae bacterium Ap0902]|nr:ROK family protein [Flavobacteriaceae bacterium Ap0902]
MSVVEKHNEYAVGIDIGGTNTKFGLVNQRGEVINSGRMKTKDYPKPKDFVEALYAQIQPMIDEVKALGNIAGIGVGAPNANFYSGNIENPPNLVWDGIIPMTDLISKKFGYACKITNDANAAALGEMMYGAARGMKDFIMITLGTGVGSGIVAGGQLIYGHDGFAGELGHTIVKPGGRKHWSTGSEGSLEAYASATGITITAKKMRAEFPNSMLNQYEESEINAKTVFECVEKGDAIAKEVFRYTGQRLGEALANFVMFSSPEAILLFGGVIQAGDYILKPAKMHMERNLFPIFRNKVKLYVSKLNEADAAILGASALVWS